MSSALFASAAAAGILLAAAAAPAAHAQSVRLERIAARVQIVPEDRRNVVAEVRKGRGDLPTPTLRSEGPLMIVDGGLDDDHIDRCDGFHPGKISGNAKFRHFHAVSAEEMPVVILHTPRDVDVVVDGAVLGEVGPAGSVRLKIAKCGAWKVADVAGRLSIDVEGMTRIDAGSAGSADVAIEGMGGINLAAARALDVKVSGMGDVKLARIDGPVNIQMDGAGAVRIAQGHASRFVARVDGIGKVRFDGVADSLEAETDGIGGIHVAEVRGPVRKTSTGISHVTVGKR